MALKPRLPSKKTKALNTSVADDQEIFRRHFEARFLPLAPEKGHERAGGAHGAASVNGDLGGSEGREDEDAGSSQEPSDCTDEAEWDGMSTDGSEQSNGIYTLLLVLFGSLNETGLTHFIVEVIDYSVPIAPTSTTTDKAVRKALMVTKKKKNTNKPEKFLIYNT